jgi:hypothetical protein
VVEQLGAAVDALGWVMKKCSRRYSVGPIWTGWAPSPANTRCAAPSIRRPPTCTLPSSSSSRERRITARIRASSSRAENGLTT